MREKMMKVRYMRYCMNDFYIGKYEVTETEWSEMMRISKSDVNGGGNYPVEKCELGRRT